MSADSALCSPDALMDEEGRKGQIRAKAGWIPNLTLTMFLQGPGATGDTAGCEWRVDDSWQGCRGNRR